MPSPPASNTSSEPRDASHPRRETLITIATYNEIENLPLLVEAIGQHAPDCDILVVDDNSPDGTGDWCDEYRSRNPKLDCLHREGKLGLGSAILAAMQIAIDRNYRYLLNMDADFSHDPKYLPDLIAGMAPEDEPARDVMIGSRYVAGGGIEGWPMKRHFMSRGVNLYARALLGLRTKDCSGGFRCYRTATLAKLDLDAFRSFGYSFQEEVLWRLKQVGAVFGESPIVFVDRLRGTSKINNDEALAALKILFALGVHNWTGRPD